MIMFSRGFAVGTGVAGDVSGVSTGSAAKQATSGSIVRRRRLDTALGCVASLG